MVKKIILVSMLYVFSFNVIAGEWSGYGKTSQLRLFDGVYILAGHPDVPSSIIQQSCGGSTVIDQFAYRNDEVFSQTLTSMLLSAEMSGREVQVYFTGNCVRERPEINGVRIKD